MPHTPVKSASRHARGFTLLEVLVAIVVTAIGLLGVAALLLSNMKNATNSSLRTQAAMLAEDAAERVMANSYWGQNASTLVMTPTISVACNGGTPTITPSNNSLLVADMTELCSKVNASSTSTTLSPYGLPNGNLSITSGYTASEGSYYTITVDWAVLTNNGGNNLTRYQYQSIVRP